MEEIRLSPVEVGSLSEFILLFTGFYTFQVVFSPDFWTINSYHLLTQLGDDTLLELPSPDTCRTGVRWKTVSKMSHEEKNRPDTLPETNIAPKNGWLEYYFPIGEAYFQGRTVSFGEGTFHEILVVWWRDPYVMVYEITPI